METFEPYLALGKDEDSFLAFLLFFRYNCNRNEAERMAISTALWIALIMIGGAIILMAIILVIFTIYIMLAKGTPDKLPHSSEHSV